MPLSLSFLGAAGTVTGSRYLLEDGQRRILIDCGLFQGLKQLRLRNRAAFPVPPASIDAVILTHAHLDHSGYLPALVRDGFAGPIYASAATRDLCDLLLPDSGHILEQDALYANRHGFSKHSPALPLYTARDAERALSAFVPLAFDQEHALPEGPSIRLLHAGHILGAASIDLRWNGVRCLFSGDIGRQGDPLMPDPETPEAADYVVIESTYGDRVHPAEDPSVMLAEAVAATIARGGTVIIPAFAVGRSQAILYHLERLQAEGRLQPVPVYLDSPMAENASALMTRHLKDHRLGVDACWAGCNAAHYVRDVAASKALDADPRPKVIVSASGMATGGRVLHHLKRYAPDPRSTILFSGYQAAGTRGAKLLAGAATVRIHGEDIPVRARVLELPGMSAHADAPGLADWLAQLKAPPKTVFIVHGEPVAADALRQRIEAGLGWPARVAEHLERVELA